MNKSIVALLSLLVVVFFAGLALADVNGASSVTPGTSERGSATDAGNASAYAGNITELTIDGISITQSWQGYFGNVSGVIELADASGDVMYNWSLASPQGEIYASTNSSVTWSGIACFNFTGTTQNLTNLESTFNIDSGDADGVNETFSVGNNHNAFTTGTSSFTLGECPSTQVYDSSGQGVDDNFEEVLLVDSFDNVVFTSLLEQDLSGFDGNAHDFEMLVLEDGHSGNTATTTYFFYVELE